MSVIYVKSLPTLPYNKSEILRYCGTRESVGEINLLLEECIDEADSKITNRLCYCEFDITKSQNIMDLGFTRTNSKLILRHFQNCQKIILFAATVGIGIDRLIAKYSRISPSKALMFQAIGAERIEALCDSFQTSVRNKYNAENRNITSRISAGYGDIPLQMQTDIFKALDCPRKIGVSLNESLLMSPSKSVTALIGICAHEEFCNDNNCNSCGKKGCDFRR